MVAIAGARAYSALSCVCARWGGVTHPGALVRAAALQFKFPIEAFSIRSTLPLPVRRNCKPVSRYDVRSTTARDRLGESEPAFTRHIAKPTVTA